VVKALDFHLENWFLSSFVTVTHVSQSLAASGRTLGRIAPM